MTFRRASVATFALLVAVVLLLSGDRRPMVISNDGHGAAPAAAGKSPSGAQGEGSLRLVSGATRWTSMENLRLSGLRPLRRSSHSSCPLAVCTMSRAR